MVSSTGGLSGGLVGGMKHGLELGDCALRLPPMEENLLRGKTLGFDNGHGRYGGAVLRLVKANQTWSYLNQLERNRCSSGVDRSRS